MTGAPGAGSIREREPGAGSRGAAVTAPCVCRGASSRSDSQSFPAAPAGRPHADTAHPQERSRDTDRRPDRGRDRDSSRRRFARSLAALTRRSAAGSAVAARHTADRPGAGAAGRRTRCADWPDRNRGRRDDDRSGMDRAGGHRWRRDHRLPDRGVGRWRHALGGSKRRHRIHRHGLRAHRADGRPNTVLPGLGDQLRGCGRDVERRERNHHGHDGAAVLGERWRYQCTGQRHGRASPIRREPGQGSGPRAPCKRLHRHGRRCGHCGGRRARGRDCRPAGPGRGDNQGINPSR